MANAINLDNAATCGNPADDAERPLEVLRTIHSFDPCLAYAIHTPGSAPEDVVLVGIVPGAVEMGVGLSPAVQEAVPRAAAALVERLTSLGFAPRRREDAIPPSPWWEKSVALSGP